MQKRTTTLTQGADGRAFWGSTYLRGLGGRGALDSTVYQVLLELKRKLIGRDFIRMVSNKPLASSLLQVYCRQQDRNFLKDFYYQDDRAEETAYVTLLEAYESKETADRVRTLQRGMRLLQESKEQAPNVKVRLRSSAGGRGPATPVPLCAFCVRTAARIACAHEWTCQGGVGGVGGVGALLLGTASLRRSRSSSYRCRRSWTRSTRARTSL